MSESWTAERWRLVESVFEAALHRPPAEREAYLREACANDSDLHRDVASLLAHAPADDPPPAWAASAAVQLITKPVVLEPGQRVGPYEILAFLASGGMGAVYRARDPRMGRDVAIKISAEQFSDRFTREVRAVAALNHPNICTVHDVGPDYLVMELVEGESLADRLQRRRALPVEDALAIARQIAAGLEAAHDKGITHRDLKPGNIRITSDGAVKVLDFGLAKVTEPLVEGGGPASPVTHSPTILTSMAGAIVGTAAYMSPEQARGKPVDKRADIWAFGIVLFEMLSGTRAYTGEMLTDVVAAVITKGPDWAALPGNVPPRIRDLLELCLQRDPRERLHDIGDARILIERYLSGSRDVKDEERAHAHSMTAWRVFPWALATGLAITVAALSVVYSSRPTGEEHLTTLSLLPPEGGAFFPGNPPAVSPDGRQIVFVAEKDGRRTLWIRSFDSTAAREVPGTEGAALPFWKPDGQSVAFLTGGKLKRIDISGSGPPLTLCDADLLRGGSWSKDDVLLFGAGNGELFRIPAAGGTVTEVTTPDKAETELRHGFPWFLPDGRHFLYTAVSTDPSKAGIYVGDLDSKTRRRVASALSNSAYVKPGYVLYAREGVLLAQPFDAAKQWPTADARPIAENVNYGAGRGQPRYTFAVSESGILTYRTDFSQDLQLTWYDRSGKVLGTIGVPGRIGYGVLSPDGHTVAFDRADPQKPFSADIWLRDMVRGAESRLTTTNGQVNGHPVWSPDGRFVAFSSGRPAEYSFQMVRQSIDGTSRAEAFGDGGGPPTDWSRDGRSILVNRMGERTGRDVWVLPLSGGRKPYPYLVTPFNEFMARMSPNGKWVAFVSDDTSRNEIYVDSFPQRTGKRRISIDGGDRPVWGRSGKELFFIGADQTMMAADVSDRGDNLDVAVPRSLFQVRVTMGLGTGQGLGADFSWFDVTDDGRFLIPTLIARPTSVPLTVVVNWTSLIRK